jgi:hypothetical protein
MRVPNNFEFYLEREIAKKINPDKARAEFLIKESEKNFRGLDKRILIMKGIEEDNVNSIIKDIYDIIIELIRAKMLLDGYSCSGSFAHEAEVSYSRNLKFTDNEVSFLNELRASRNSITYYGKILNKEYAEKCYDFLRKVYPKLMLEVKNTKTRG